jgi:acyl dehydratase
LVFAFVGIAKSFGKHEYRKTNHAGSAAVPDERLRPNAFPMRPQIGYTIGDNRRKGQTMIELERPADLGQYVGKEIGVSDWFTVDQALIDKFADATGDHQWIHVDVERAKREMPGGKTIAHGWLTLSLVPRLASTLYRVKNRSRGINYGANRVRFTGMVPAGSRIRLRLTIKSVEPVEGGVRTTSAGTMELEGSDRPVLVAETIGVTYD